MKKYITLVLSVIVAFYFVSSCNKSKKKFKISLQDANVRYISQYASVMIASPDLIHSEGNILLINELETIIQERLTFLLSGKCSVLERGGSEGLITYTEENSYDILKYNIETNFEDNYIVYTGYEGKGIIKDTIRDFVILEDLKIIMPKKDFEIFEKEKKLEPNNRSNPTITFYKYN